MTTENFSLVRDLRVAVLFLTRVPVGRIAGLEAGSLAAAAWAFPLAGLIVGNKRHKATLLINRFHDGLAWLCQIAMFLILGLLITPSSLIPVILPAVGIAAALVFIVAMESPTAGVWYPNENFALRDRCAGCHRCS